MTKENWKPISDWPSYEVSDLGRVRRVETGLILAGAYTKGRRRVTLRRNPIQANALVYRLVAEAFIPNPEGKPMVNHIDGNPQNDAVSNLEWVTAFENYQHAKDVLNKMGGFHPGFGSRHHQSKLKESDIPVIRRLVAEGMKTTQVAEMFGVKNPTIHHIVNRVNWSHIP